MDEFQEQVIRQLSRMAEALERLANGGEDFEPNYQFSLEDYAGFDWQGINAEIAQSDEFGPTHVRHGGLMYTRRSPQNKFGEAIWFSRPHGRDEDGNVKYLRLVTFKKVSQAEPLPGKVANAVGNGSGKSNGNGHQQTSQQQQPKATPPPQQPAPKAVTYEDFLVEVGRAGWGQRTADAIATAAQVKGTDFSTAMPFLAYFIEAKKHGLTFDLAKNHLVSHKNDPEKAKATLA